MVAESSRKCGTSHCPESEERSVSCSYGNQGGLLSSGVDQVWLLRTPGNMSIADTLDIYVLRVGLQGGQFGYATAIGLIQGLVGLVLVVACNKICKKMTEVSLW